MMLNNNLFVSGSIHQGDNRFSDVSRGDNTFYESFSVAVRKVSSCSVSRRTINIVDQILK